MTLYHFSPRENGNAASCIARALARRFAIAFGDLPSASLRRISFLFAVLDIPIPQLTGCR